MAELMQDATQQQCLPTDAPDPGFVGSPECQPGSESVTIDISQNQRDQQQQQEKPRLPYGRLVELCRNNNGNILNRPCLIDPVSVIFVLLIIGGGVWGYISKDSTVSLVAGVVFGLLLAFAAYYEGARKNPYPLLALLGFLFIMFAYRYAQAWKFMPSGLFALLTFIMLLRNFHIIYVKRQQTPAAAPS